MLLRNYLGFDVVFIGDLLCKCGVYFKNIFDVFLVLQISFGRG